MKALITFALANEFAPWREGHAFRPENMGRGAIFVAQIGAVEVTALITGVGPDRARAAVAAFIEGESEAIDLCISSGFAGALKPAYPVGTVLAARTVSQQSGLNESACESHPLLLTAAVESGATLVDCFCTASRAVTTAAEKHRLSAQADAVEMEGFEVMRAAEKCGVPSVAIRAVSDGADEDLPLDVNSLLAGGQVSVPRVIGQIARRPQSLPGLVRLGRQSRMAAQSLAQFLDRYLVALGSGAHRLPGTLAVTAAAR
jgi:adenosylhomocysteine nucleosidase